MGCYMSHLRILKDAEAKGYASALIFEDDLDPVPDALSRLGAVNDLPQDWDMVYLGFHYHHHPGDYAGPLDASDCQPVSNNLCKLKMPVLEQTHALAVHKRAYKPLIRMLTQAIA